MSRLKLSGKTLRSDLVSGFATGLFSIPEGMAYAKLAGVNPVYGLYSGMISTVVASLTTGSILMISTLTSAIALSTASVIQVAGIQHSQVPQALFTITFLVGAVMFVMGLLRLGSVVNFVSNAVVILRARYQESVSSTALKWLERYASELRGSGNLLMLAGVESHVIQKLEKAGLMDQIGKENVFASGPVLEASLNEAFDAAEAWLKKKA